jgi:hypothetical protein
MLWVAGSFPKYVMMSPQPTSSIEPSETTALKPTFSRLLQSSTAVRSAPLWLTNPTVPGEEIPAAKVAFRPVGGRITPRQFGPTIRIPFARAVARIWRSSSAPSAPTSLKPAEMMTTALTPAAAHSSTVAGIVVAGVAMTTSSGTSGSDAMFG